jgi:GMP synthase (glutamine-hydrolysing)
LRAQITVLDAGGQYCHLIARKVRDLGVFAEVAPSETPASELAGRKGVIISGGPSSVYDPGSPTIDPALLHSRIPVLGICYGQQLMAHLLGGRVEKGTRGEYGFAQLELSDRLSDNLSYNNVLLRGVESPQQVWMSHRDLVTEPPPGFTALGATSTCSVAAMSASERGLFAVQFHPEVAHTPCGPQILSNFLFDICGCLRDWNPTGEIHALEEQIRAAAGDRSVFFFVSGGVDSTVAYTLCLKALGPQRVHGAYVDTGLMREGETEFVRTQFAALGAGAQAFRVENAGVRFLSALEHAIDPERKRHIIGEEFVKVQERILESERYLDGRWILGQGTIYPDTIESGGSAKADLIKTHHNRVAGIQRLIDQGRIIEPLASFYKDEVRAIGRELGLPAELLDRHPFPGPGLAIRCLCGDTAGAPEKTAFGWVLPVRSVGVQGDSRTYRAVLAIEDFPATAEEAAHLVNQTEGVNRVVVTIAGHAGELKASPARLSPERLVRLRRADAIVRRLSHESGFDRQIWQFPVVLIPFGTEDQPDSVVLRPIDSVDGMTANVVRMPEDLLERMARELTAVEGVAGVFYDLTNKPPATIEWE